MVCKLALKPWYKLVTPREDLREGRPLDASEFAVHLDQIREGRAPDDYQNPVRFLDRTYLTENLEKTAAEVVRRLSGVKTETSAVFNLSTQFGGGKTHFLALLYHLATSGPVLMGRMDVASILSVANVQRIPETATAIFVGTEFESRGGENGEPLRKTPWGEIAWQLGGAEAFKLIEESDAEMRAPGSELIRKVLPKDKACLILMDEIMNYISRFRKAGMATQFYNFLQNLSEEARGQDRVVLVVSIPASELEMTADDQSDYSRLKKLLDRLGKAVVMSSKEETSEIIRRRLFEWQGVPKEAKDVIIKAYAEWAVEHRNLIGDFPVDHAKEAFMASYPFHPTLISVFERKWQSLPRFQQTRGILRLLALWISNVYREGYRKAGGDLLICIGSAPLDDSLFKSAMFEQLGESKLDIAMTTDICCKNNSHATMLDKEAMPDIKKANLHQKVATTIFFESNGGQTANALATIPEIRAAVCGPEIDIGNIDTVLENLSSACYYLRVDRNRYRFSHKPELNKLLADRKATIQESMIKDKVYATVQKYIPSIKEIDRVPFPEKSSQISDRASLTLVILPPDPAYDDEKKRMETVEAFTKESGTSTRTFKNALIWAAPESSASLYEEARKLLSWEEIKAEEDELQLDDVQKKQLSENIKKGTLELKEAVWKTYKNLMLLGKDNKIRTIDFGLIHSSASDSIVTLYIDRLKKDGDIESSISPNFLTRNWPPAFKNEWSTKSVRDMFFASPLFPRLIDPEVIKETISRGVSNGIFAYGGKTDSGGYNPLIFKAALNKNDVEVSEDMYIISNDAVTEYLNSISNPPIPVPPTTVIPGPSAGGSPEDSSSDKEPEEGYRPTTDPEDSSEVIEGGDDGFKHTSKESKAKKLVWDNEIPPQKWTNFYTKVLTKFAGKGLKLSLKVEVEPADGISKQKIEEMKIALRELGMDDELIIE
ncbi:ATP-binding protein [Methanosarcina sp. Kolksee]|uniref:ATP-binding protein n=1 Tax=Methanosarcina sp. Kolksee TaxID=1434099 RepID=UPI0018CE96A2|nr:DUF499 domain-containing protein [Methanosarcina sp. Kolksee]